MTVIKSADQDNTEKKVRSSYFDLPAMDISQAFPQATPASTFPPCTSDYYHFNDLLTPEEQAVRRRVRECMEKEVAPIMTEYWEKAEFPFQIIPKLGALRVAGGSIKGYGCPGLSITANAIATAEIARVDASCGTFMLVHASLGMLTIALCGSEAQKQKHLPSLAQLTTVACWALTEPDNRSDASGLITTAKKNTDVTEAIQKVAYDCKIVEGVLSHQMKQHVIDGNKVVLSVSTPETTVDDVEFEENEVYAIDIVASTGDGKPKLLDEKQTTIYKKDETVNYQLKMKASRFIISEIKQNFSHMPFTARSLEEKRARLGLVECVNHGHVQPYPVLYEKPGDFVAPIKFTVLLMPNGSDRITSHTLQELQPTKTIDDPEIKGWLALGIKKKKGGGKKKKGKKAGEKGEAGPMDARSDAQE